MPLPISPQPVGGTVGWESSKFETKSNDQNITNSKLFHGRGFGFCSFGFVSDFVFRAPNFSLVVFWIYDQP